MKKSDVSYDQLVNYDVIKNNYNEISRNTRHKEKLLKFDLFNSININSVFEELKNKRYRHSKFNIFLIREPKYRIVMSECIKDKLVNHMLSNEILKPVLYKKLIDENVATILDRGTDAAIRYSRKYFLRMMNKYGNFYVLEFDIAKYFYNIDHDILKKKLDVIYKDENIKNILYEIIDSTNHKYINDEIDYCIKKELSRLSSCDNKDAERRKEELLKIPHYIDGKGLGIGSLSSQIFAVFYLNELDHYIKENLGIKEYIRYMDDGIIFSNDIEKLRQAKIKIERLLSKLNLKLNKKTQIYSSNNGFEFVGYKFKCENGKLLIRIKNDTKRRMKKKFFILEKYDEEKLMRVKASYKGLLSYCTTKSLYDKYYS